MRRNLNLKSISSLQKIHFNQSSHNTKDRICNFIKTRLFKIYDNQKKVLEIFDINTKKYKESLEKIFCKNIEGQNAKFEPRFFWKQSFCQLHRKEQACSDWPKKIKSNFELFHSLWCTASDIDFNKRWFQTLKSFKLVNFLMES